MARHTLGVLDADTDEVPGMQFTDSPYRAVAALEFGRLLTGARRNYSSAVRRKAGTARPQPDRTETDS
jgi:hypothetical protein